MENKFIVPRLEEHEDITKKQHQEYITDLDAVCYYSNIPLSELCSPEQIFSLKGENMFRRPGLTNIFKEKKQDDKIKELEKTNEKLTKLVSKLATLVGTLNLKEKDKEKLNEVKMDLRKLMDGELDEKS